MCICLIISNYFPLEEVYNVIYRVEMNFFLILELQVMKHIPCTIVCRIQSAVFVKSNFLTKPSNTRKSVSLEIK